MRRFLTTLTAIGGLLALSFGTAAAADYKWRMATIAPENSFVFNIFPKYFAEKVNLWSNGRIEIEVFGSGVLAHPFKLYDAVQEGTVDIAWSYPGFLVNADPVNAIFAGFPGGMAPETFMHWAYMDGGQELWEEYRREKMGLVGLYCGQGTTEIFAHSHKPVRSAEDLKGYKHRSTGAWASILKDEFGGAPTVTPFGEIFGMLQRKSIDGVEYAGPGGNLALGYHKIAKYIIFPGVHQPSSSQEIFMKSEVFDALPDDLQQVVRDAAKATVINSWLELGNADQTAMEEYRNSGNELIMMDDALVAQIEAAGRQWIETNIEEQDAADPLAQKILESYKAYQAAWSQNAFTRAQDRE